MTKIDITFEEWCFEFSPILKENNKPVNFKNKEKIIDNADEEQTLWSFYNSEIINCRIIDADEYYITQEHYDNSIEIVVQIPD